MFAKPFFLKSYLEIIQLAYLKSFKYATSLVGKAITWATQ